MKFKYYVYMMTNYMDTVLYTGVTNNIIRRVYEHKHKLGSAFTSKYNLNKLVYVEKTDNIRTAISREKQIQTGMIYTRFKILHCVQEDICVYHSTEK